jgi:uncharacterized protein HemX
LATDDSKLERILGEHGAQLNQRIEVTASKLESDVQQIQRQLNNTHGDLLVADAAYLLSVANQKLLLVGDVKSVLAAMEAADQRLLESGDPVAYKVREVLAEEMSALKKVHAPDVVGISARLIALEKKVATLPLVLPHAGTVKEHEKEKAEAPAAADEQGDALDHAWEEIKDLVTVRRTDRPIEAVLAPEQAEALRQILLLKLETTRAALFRNDERLFHDSLGTALDWLGQHFDASSEDTQSVQAELKDLLASSLGTSYPDISRAMKMLQDIEKLRLEAEMAATKPKTTAAPAAPEPAPQPPSPEKGKSEPAADEKVPDAAGGQPKPGSGQQAPEPVGESGQGVTEKPAETPKSIPEAGPIVEPGEERL